MKRLLSSFLIGLILCMSTFPIYAASTASASTARKATPSNASRSPSIVASPSNAGSGLNLLDSTVFDYASASTRAVVNDIEITSIWKNDMNRQSTSRGSVGSDGFIRFPRPADGYQFARLSITIRKSRLPSSGTYGFNLRIPQGNIDLGPISTTTLQVISWPPNVTVADTKSVEIFSNNTGDAYYFRGNVKIDLYTEYFRLYVDFQDWTDADQVDIASTNFYLSFKTSTYDDTATGSSDISIDVDSINAENTNTIRENTDTLVDGQNTTNSLLLTVIQTISNQLEAFWNQLAGEFTNLFNKMNQHHQEDLDKVDEQMENDNENTEYLANGYDNNGMNSDNDRLESKLNDYQDQEEQVINQVSDQLNDFSYDLDFSALTGPVSDIGYFLTGIYNGLGALNIPIAFSLTIMIALLAIGYYRFKGGA